VREGWQYDALVEPVPRLRVWIILGGHDGSNSDRPIGPPAGQPTAILLLDDRV
jgi:hypothetical protein